MLAVCGGRGEEEGGDSATPRHSSLFSASRVRALTLLLLSKVEKGGAIAQTGAHAHCLIHVRHCEKALSMLVAFGLSVFGPQPARTRLRAASPSRIACAFY